MAGKGGVGGLPLRRVHDTMGFSRTSSTQRPPPRLLERCAQRRVTLAAGDE